MKSIITSFIRKALPVKAISGLESIYRIVRIYVISALYGFPAKRLKIIAVTGTNGKTTTVNFVNEILKMSGYRTAMFSTAQIEVAGKMRKNDLNATVGTVQHMQQFFRTAKRSKVDYVVMEFPSHALVQHKLDAIPIEVAVMTNLTQDHLDYHKTMQRYAEAKALLFKRHPRYIVLNHDDDWFDFYDQFPAYEKKLNYGESKESNVGVSDYHSNDRSNTATISYEKKAFHVKTHLPGKFNIYNATAAASVGLLLGVSSKNIEEGLRALISIPGRFEFVDQPLECSVIVDYAHTPDGLEKILTAVREITTGSLILVFGSCGDRDKAKRPVMGEIAARLADSIYLTDEETYSEDGNEIRQQIFGGIKQGGGQRKTTEIADREEAIRRALKSSNLNDTVLVTGLGHEVYRIMAGKKIPWNDTEVIKRVSADLKK